MQHIISRYSADARNDAANQMIKTTIYDAIQKENLNCAGLPNVTEVLTDEGKDFSYVAVFEVFPEIKPKELEKDKIDQVEAKVSDSDVDATIEKLREQQKDWVAVSRPAAQGDKLEISFEGFLGDKAFPGGSSDHHELVIGSATMIPGFEEALVGHSKDEDFTIDVTFPADYNHADLAGKAASFKINIQSISEGKLPELNDDFAKLYNVKEGGIDALKEDIKKNMVRELDKRVSAMNREKLFDRLLEVNEFDAPAALVDREIEDLKHEMYHRIYGHEHHDNEKIPNFPREIFEKRATHRVQLGLLLSEYAKKHELKPNKEKVEAKLDQLAEAYENPEELRQWYKKDPSHLQEIEALIIEEMAAEKIAEHATMVSVKKTYDEVMNPQAAPAEGKSAAKPKSSKSKKAKSTPEENTPEEGA
jgi:trigger factor